MSQDYKDDRFLYGNTKFNQFFDSLTHMYQTYVTSDETQRARIDAHFDQTTAPVSVFLGRGKYGPMGGLRGYLHGIGITLGIDDFDQRMAEFHPENERFDPELAKAKQREVYRDSLAGYEKWYGTDKMTQMFAKQTEHADALSHTGMGKGSFAVPNRHEMKVSPALKPEVKTADPYDIGKSIADRALPYPFGNHTFSTDGGKRGQQASDRFGHLDVPSVDSEVDRDFDG